MLMKNIIGGKDMFGFFKNKSKKDNQTDLIEEKTGHNSSINADLESKQKSHSDELKVVDSSESITRRGVEALKLFTNMKYNECYELLKNSDLGLRPKDESILSISAFFTDRFEECLTLCNKLIEYDQNTWAGDRKVENAYKFYSNYIIDFIQKLPKITNERYIQSVEQHDESYIESHDYLTVFRKLIQSGNPKTDLYNENDVHILCKSESTEQTEHNYFALGEFLFSTKHYDLASMAYRLAYNVNPNKALYYGYYGHAKFRESTQMQPGPNRVVNLLEGYICLKRAIQLESENAKWHFLLSQILLLLAIGSLPLSRQAKEALDKAKSLCRETQKGLLESIESADKLISEIFQVVS